MELVIGTAGDRDFSIDAQQLVTGRTCIIAQSGAGKSWAIAVLCERLCAAGIGFVIVDTEGEYSSLREKFPVLWVGSEEGCDEDIEKVGLKDLMLRAVVNGTAVVFDVSETEMRERVAALAGVLYDIASVHRIPYLLILEEADKFVPQAKESIKKIEEISRRGRKRGLGLLVATQRPSFVTKNVLSQCNNQIIGRLTIENDLRAVDLFFGSRTELEELAALQPGEFFVMGGFVRKKTRIRFGNRETEHRGETPEISRRREAPGVPGRAAVPPSGGRSPPGSPGTGTAPAAPPRTGLPGIRPAITREAAVALAGRRRVRGILGRRGGRLASVELVAWPVAEVRVKFRGGLLGRSVRNTSFLLDAVSGDLVRIRRGFSRRPGFSEVVGLPADAVHVLSRLPLTGATPAEVEVLSGLPRDAAAEALGALRERRLVTEAGRAGRERIFIPLLAQRLPSIPALKGGSDMPLLGEGSGKPREVQVTEGQVREVLKGIEPTAEVASFTLFSYPLYELTFAGDGREKRVYLDAVTGKEAFSAGPG